MEPKNIKNLVKWERWSRGQTSEKNVISMGIENVISMGNDVINGVNPKKQMWNGYINMVQI